MTELKDLFQSADWKAEKHVPVLEAPDTVKKGTWCTVTVSVGKEIAHPNTTEHHIAGIDVYFHAQGEKFPYQLGTFTFTAHGACTKGPNASTVYTHATVSIKFKTDVAGVIFASSYCNIHGLWQNQKCIGVA